MFNKLESSQIELLKWIAIILMVMDHSGRILFNDNEYLIALGRIAFPLFAYILAHNYFFFTKNKNKQLLSILAIAIISQPIYVYVFDSNILNIMFTLFAGLLSINLYENLKEKLDRIHFINSMIVLFVFIIVMGYFVEYVFFGIFLIISMYTGFKLKNNNLIPVSIVLILLSNLPRLSLAPVGILSLPLILLSKKMKFKIRRVNKYLFYLFYPIHLLLLHSLFLFL